MNIRHCERCGVYVDVAGNPIDAADSRTLCYDCADTERQREREREGGRVCAVCGRPSRYIFAFPSGDTASVGVVYDGASVCSAECAHELQRQRRSEGTSNASGEGGEASAPRSAPPVPDWLARLVERTIPAPDEDTRGLIGISLKRSRTCGGCGGTEWGAGPCSWCEGTGEDSGDSSRDCAWCGGSGVAVQCAGCGALLPLSAERGE